ncbi:GNAT family N-acetyltransferase [Streptococcus ruminantium]|uniref:GNAT family N-acetyltransferase n=1 Tax=Streptococcus ruminantium TaxID=1917441 RepID=UPI0028107457|nr:GNAT family N-acetyltransferase [Streptococcus ruminantium]MDQ8807286.1 GNAT family N-acetyltransferase [Streptococcus ruminantium]
MLERMIERAKELNFKEIIVKEIYDWNEDSRKLFEKCGFIAVKKLQKADPIRR